MIVYSVSGDKCEPDTATKKLEKIEKKGLTKRRSSCIIIYVAWVLRKSHGGIAQLVEHLPYKQGVTGSSPVVPTIKPFYLAR